MTCCLSTRASVGIASGNNAIGERHARGQWINRHSGDGL